MVGSLQAEQNAKAAQTQAANIAKAMSADVTENERFQVYQEEKRQAALEAQRAAERNAEQIATEYEIRTHEQPMQAYRLGEQNAVEIAEAYEAQVREQAVQAYREGEREAVSIAEQVRLNAVDAARWAGVAVVAQGKQEEKKPWWEQIAQTWNETIATPLLNIWNTTSKQITNAWNFVTTPIVNAWDTVTRVVKDIAVDVFRFFYNARGEDLVKVSEDEILRSPEIALWKTYIAAAINVQREGVNLGGYTSGKGPAQLSQQQLDTDRGEPYPYGCKKISDKNAMECRGYGLGLKDENPYDPNIVVEGMTIRVEQVLKYAENQSERQDIILDETDRFIIIALSQNGPGFDQNDVSIVFSEYIDEDGKVNWEKYFKKEYEDWKERPWLERTHLEVWQWIKTGERGKDFDTEFSLEMYYQEMRALESQGYPFPEGLDTQRIEDLMNTSEQAKQESK